VWNPDLYVFLMTDHMRRVMQEAERQRLARTAERARPPKPLWSRSAPASGPEDAPWWVVLRALSRRKRSAPIGS